MIGHVARDLLPAGAWRLGGTAAYAALTARRLGLRAAIVTAAPTDVLAALASAMPGVPVAAVPSAAATTFANIYDGGHRRQYLRDRATPLGLDAVPPAMRLARVVLLAPLAREVAPELAAAFPAALVAATPQGWLRAWDGEGLVRPAPWGDADRVLPHLRALILSREDLMGPALADPGADPGADALAGASADDTGAGVARRLAAWARPGLSLVVTDGAAGADLIVGGAVERVPAHPAREVDPTGAGDVFAAAFLSALADGADDRAAVDFAHRAAAYSVEREGLDGIPTRAMVEARR
ncbi:MAG TPA: PfkB family carbohydrate kinase [Ktedonobacterales bacterium]